MTNQDKIYFNESCIRITTFKPYAIHFKHKGKYYLLHYSNEDYENWWTLYEKEKNEFGNFKLKFISQKMNKFVYLKDDKSKTNTSIVVKLLKFMTYLDLCDSCYKYDIEDRKKQIEIAYKNREMLDIILDDLVKGLIK